MDTLKLYPDTEMAFQNGVFVHENMNNLVRLAQEKKASHIFFVEHDMVFEPDTLGRLLEQDKDIISAPYSGRTLPLQPLVYQRGTDEELYMMSYDIWPKKPFKCYGVPTGCTLIKMSVFEKIKPPYFFFEHTEDGVIKMSQDIYFCKKANEAGIEVWCDPTIMVGHIGDYQY
jgi:GT2 family glycosyltransferase